MESKNLPWSLKKLLNNLLLQHQKGMHGVIAWIMQIVLISLSKNVAILLEWEIIFYD